MNRKSILFLAIAFFAVHSARCLSQARDMGGHDVLLSIPYAAKAVLPLVFLPGALEEPEKGLPNEALFLGAMTLPNAMALAKVYSGDADGTRRWRKTVFWCDLGLAAAAAGLGAYLIASSASRSPDPGFGWDASVGFVIIGLGALPLAASSLVDRIPFNLEDDLAHLSLGLKLPPPGSAAYVPGLAVGLSLGIR
jgi:hypothetical protein